MSIVPRARGLSAGSRRRRRRVVVESLEPRILLFAPGEDPFGSYPTFGDDGGLDPHGPPLPEIPDFVAGELLIGFDGDELIDTYLSEGAAAAMSSALTMLDEWDLYEPDFSSGMIGQDILSSSWQLPENIDIGEVAEHIGQLPGIRFAEPNYVVQASVIPNDPLFDQLYGLNNTSSGADIDAPQAWESTTGSRDVVIGVIDGGINHQHEDLYLNVWINQDEIPAIAQQSIADVDGDGALTFVDLNHDDNQGIVLDTNNNIRIDGSDVLAAWSNGSDDDGNGFVDDLIGWDFYEDDNNPFDGGGHGSHTSGTIGAIGNNNRGVVGVNWDVQIMGLRFLSDQGSGSTLGAIKAINYATDMRQNGVNIVATNNSWGGSGFSNALLDAIEANGDAGMLFVAAAGNSGNDTDLAPEYPAAYDGDNIISVAATNSSDELASFSNFGVQTVDLAAPGVDILSTITGDDYDTFSGTSMASPHVAGAVALAFAYRPDATAAEIRKAVLDSVDPVPGLGVATGGRLNANRMLDFLSVEQGRIRLDREAYPNPGTAAIQVFDGDLNQDSETAETVTVLVESDSETDGELVVLTETGPATSTFVNTIALAPGEAAADGVLQVIHGDTIVATYEDASDGQNAVTVTDTAYVDSIFPEIHDLEVLASGSTATVVWTTSEDTDALVRYGSSADDLSMTEMGTSGTEHDTTLGGLTPETTYYFEAVSADAAGNLVVVGVREFTTSQMPDILFVDDDEGDLLERYFEAAFDAGGYQFDTYDVAEQQDRAPDVELLSAYKVVVWNTGANFIAPTSGLTFQEQFNLAQFMDQGGNVFLTGQDILVTGKIHFQFAVEYLHLSGTYAPDVGVLAVQGIDGDPVTDGLVLDTSRMPPEFQGNFGDMIVPATGADGILTATETTRPSFGATHAALRYPASNDPSPFPGGPGGGGPGGGGPGGGTPADPPAQGPSGSAADPPTAPPDAEDPYRIVFFPFAFEGISTEDADPNNQAAVMDRVLTWLGADSGPGVSIRAADGQTISEDGESADVKVVLSTRPSADVSMTLSSSDASEALLVIGDGQAADEVSLTFTPDNWDTPQIVNVIGQDDEDLDGDIEVTIESSTTSSDDEDYNELQPRDILFVNLDNEIAPLIAVNGIVENVASQWQTVTLSEEFLSPVILATANYTAEQNSGVVRIRNAGGNQFEIRVDSTIDNEITPIDVHFFAVEEGLYNEEDHGITMEVVRFESTTTSFSRSFVGQPREYQHEYENPIVLGQVMSYNDSDWSEFFATALDDTIAPPAAGEGFSAGKHVGESFDRNRDPETIGYVVLEAGVGTLNGIGYLAGGGPKTVRGIDNAPPHVYELEGLESAASAVASQVGMDGFNGGWAILYGEQPVTPDALNLAIDEDQTDNERWHTTEHVNFIVFEDAVVDAAPVVDLDGDDSSGQDEGHFATTFNEAGDPVQVADDDATISDEDHDTLVELKAHISNLSDGEEEILTADVSGTGLSSEFNEGVLVVSGEASLDDYLGVLKSIRYQNTAAVANLETRLINITVSDGIRRSAVATTSVEIITSNDPPEVGTNTGATVDEGSDATIGSSQLAASDPNEGPADLTFEISSAPQNGELLINGDAVTSFTQQQVDNGDVSYVHDGSETDSDEFGFVLSDGRGGELAGSFNIIVNPINDDPGHELPGDQTTGQNTSLTFSSENENTILVGDADAGDNSIVTTVSVSAGSLTTAESNATSDGDGSDSVALSGTIAEINSSLDGLTFTPSENFSGEVTLTIVTNDQGHFGDGGERETTDSLVINVSAAAAPHLQTGWVVVGSEDGWKTVNLPRDYESLVVVVTPNYDEFSAPIIPRVRNAAGSSFEVAVARTDGSDDPIPAIKMQFMAVEEGVYNEADNGVNMEAVKYTSTRTDRVGFWVGEERDFQNSYDQPVVVGQVMTDNSDWTVFWTRGLASKNTAPNANGFRAGKHVGEYFLAERGDETVGYVVIEAGSGTIGEVDYFASTGRDSVRGITNNPPYSYGLEDLANPTGAVASSAGMDGGNGGWPVLYGDEPITAEQVRLAIDEDQWFDAERNHTTEQVAVIVFSDDAAISDDSEPSGGGSGSSSEEAQEQKRVANLDANQDGYVAPLDALQLIVFLDFNGTQTLDALEDADGDEGADGFTLDRFDINNDNYISSIDALMIIVDLNAFGTVAAPPPGYAVVDGGTLPGRDDPIPGLFDPEGPDDGADGEFFVAQTSFVTGPQLAQAVVPASKIEGSQPLEKVDAETLPELVKVADELAALPRANYYDQVEQLFGGWQGPQRQTERVDSEESLDEFFASMGRKPISP